MPEMTYREAICKALADELRTDPDVIFFGEDVAAAGGVFKVTPGLLEEFGGERVRDTPISEQAIVGAGLGDGLHWRYSAVPSRARKKSSWIRRLDC